MSGEKELDIRIWVDADACPNDIKEVIYRASKRLALEVILVANQSLRVPESKLVSSIIVRDGADVADDAIIAKMSANDLVVTGDIPLAARAVDKGGVALGVRGELFDEANVKSRLAARNLMEQLRASGMETSGPKPLNKKDVQAFANQLDRLLTKMGRAGN